MAISSSAQQDAVIAHNGSALVVACPGSGKTRVLICRVLRELAGPPPSRRRVAAVTYTNRAADEMWSRLDDEGGARDRLWAGTMHAFCLEWILRPYAGYSERLRRGFRVVDERHQAEILTACQRRYTNERYLDVVTRMGRDGVARNSSALAQKVSDAYHAELRALKVIDFDLILSVALELVIGVPEIPRVLGAMFSLVCVDEYQDTHELQYAILASVIRASEGGCSLFMVGDPEQAIYSGLGGLAKSLDQIRDEFGIPGMARLSLSGNYRSTQRIVDYFANFSGEPHSVKALGRHANEAGAITFQEETVSSSEIPEVVAGIVRDRIAQGCAEHEIAILAPQWFMVTRIARQLATLLPGVHFDAPGLSPFRQCRDNVWYRLARIILSTPSPSMYGTRLRWAAEVLAEFGRLGYSGSLDRVIEPRSLLRMANGLSLSHGEGLDALDFAFVALCNELRVDVPGHPALEALRSEFFTSARKCLADQEYTFPNSIDAFRRAFGRGPGVVVGTCQSVKGEEFDTVVAFGLLEGYVPHWNDIFKGEARAEMAAQRLLYVIASRAKRHLHLISESGRETLGGRRYDATKRLKQVRYKYDVK